MKFKHMFATIMATIFLTANIAYADHHEGGEDAHHAKADTNNDGKISFDEFKASREQHMQEHFKKADANGDGFIDQDEKKAMKEKMKNRHERRKDKREEKN